MASNISGSAGYFPQTYIVSPAIKSIPVPIQRDPTQGHEILAHLKAGTAVKVVSRSSLWLCIELPAGQRGYIQAAQARPATPEEALVDQAAAAAEARPGGTRSQAAILPMETRLTAPPRRRVGYGFSASAFGLGILACLFAFILDTIVMQNCPHFEASCTNSQPLAIPAIVLVVGGFALFALSIIALIAAFILNLRRR